MSNMPLKTKLLEARETERERERERERVMRRKREIQKRRRRWNNIGGDVELDTERVTLKDRQRMKQEVVSTDDGSSKQRNL